jgi:hypothetical protein
VGLGLGSDLCFERVGFGGLVGPGHGHGLVVVLPLI